ncbi:MAG TPA: NTP transferase domain-containing protein [Candidatus Cybelea sp.]|nr:NTP transferase domain-containing protein [Candidatus Cybelea sp.]
MTAPHVRAVILAAGSSRRMGAQKLSMLFRGRPLLEYAVASAQRWDPLLVAGPEIFGAFAGRVDVTLVLNSQPQRGMTHSLALADAAIHPGDAIVVLLGDKPLVTEQLIARLCAARADADVAYPVRAGDGVPGHPVFFSPAARRRIGDLPLGDTLHLLRDDPAMARLPVPTLDEGAFFDVDTPGELGR